MKLNLILRRHLARAFAAALALGCFASAPATVIAQAPTRRIAGLGRAQAPAPSPVPGFVSAIAAGFSSAPDAGWRGMPNAT